MPTETFEQKRRDFLVRCEVARDDLEGAQRRIYTNLQKATRVKREFWNLFDLSERLRDLYPPEISIASKFLAESQTWTEADSGLLERCSDILTTLDAEACALKGLLPAEVKSPFVRWYEHKCSLRELVRLHWDVLDGLKAQQEDLKSVIRDEIRDLETALRGLGFFTCVFISYAHVDNKSPKAAYLDHLVGCIREPLRDRHIFLWWDRKPLCDETNDFCNHGLISGEEWNEEIKSRLTDLDVFLALLSPGFDDSSYIENVEQRKILNARKETGAYLIPIPIHESRTEKDFEIHRTQFFQPNAKRIADLYRDDRNELETLYRTDLVQAIQNGFEICSDRRKMADFLRKFQGSAATA